mmetsp:Transcript_46867/g.120775  ORF Transcript_46867/g.120775 Transcript_46867/m.120775 type:complete len:221 (+) Transcript_46867:738-1400(+)
MMGKRRAKRKAGLQRMLQLEHTWKIVIERGSEAASCRHRTEVTKLERDPVSQGHFGLPPRKKRRRKRVMIGRGGRPRLLRPLLPTLLVKWLEMKNAAKGDGRVQLCLVSSRHRVPHLQRERAEKRRTVVKKWRKGEAVKWKTEQAEVESTAKMEEAARLLRCQQVVEVTRKGWAVRWRWKEKEKQKEKWEHLLQCMRPLLCLHLEVSKGKPPPRPSQYLR